MKSSEYLEPHPIEVTSKITIKIQGREFTISIEEARNLLNSLNMIVGPTSILYPSGVGIRDSQYRPLAWLETASWPSDTTTCSGTIDMASLRT